MAHVKTDMTSGISDRWHDEPADGARHDPHDARNCGERPACAFSVSTSDPLPASTHADPDR
jgi:hypothetical protein